LGLCTASDVRVLTGVTEATLSDGEVESLIAFSDQQISDDIGPFEGSVPTRIKNLSALLAAIKIYTRPDHRGGFSIGDVTITGQQVEEALDRWARDVNRIYAYYGKAVQEAPSTFKLAK
jgi:hypothetical protein